VVKIRVRVMVRVMVRNCMSALAQSAKGACTKGLGRDVVAVKQARTYDSSATTKFTLP